MSGGDEFYQALITGIDSLQRLVGSLQETGKHHGVWRDFTTERAHGELEGLLGRLRDTTQEEWVLRSAWSWLSPLDVHEIRDGVDLLFRIDEAQRAPISSDDRRALETLAGLLDRYIISGEPRM